MRRIITVLAVAALMAAMLAASAVPALADPRPVLEDPCEGVLECFQVEDRSDCKKQIKAAGRHPAGFKNNKFCKAVFG
jgi:hypothetical protein